ncbi:unnamed protein product [Parnassius apollo]|uniref:(apollo) hypothetical protein n=1 Tax=Parnassius apollo TaxID=110799 RepID=A0A8S3WBQ2_PARAO|nr:unnamed protein product [Parnassius apollo]
MEPKVLLFFLLIGAAISISLSCNPDSGSNEEGGCPCGEESIEHEQPHQQPRPCQHPCQHCSKPKCKGGCKG